MTFSYISLAFFARVSTFYAFFSNLVGFVEFVLENAVFNPIYYSKSLF